MWPRNEAGQPFNQEEPDHAIDFRWNDYAVGVHGRCGHCASADPPGKTARLWIYAGSDRQPTQVELQPTQDELEKIDKDNQLLNLPASQDDIIGAGQAPWLDGEITDVCPNCESAEDAVHQWSWPIYNGSNHQPTQDELRALHQQDVRAIRETDQQYDRLMSKE